MVIPANPLVTCRVLLCHFSYLEALQDDTLKTVKVDVVHPPPKKNIAERLIVTVSVLILQQPREKHPGRLVATRERVRSSPDTVYASAALLSAADGPDSSRSSEFTLMYLLVVLFLIFL